MELSPVGPQAVTIPQAAVVSTPVQPRESQQPVVAETPPPPAEPQKPSAEQMKQAVDEVRTAVNAMAQNLQFSIDKETGKTIVKVVDASTEEVIRQIPPEEILVIAKAIDGMQQGLLIRQKA